MTGREHEPGCLGGLEGRDWTCTCSSGWPRREQTAVEVLTEVIQQAHGERADPVKSRLQATAALDALAAAGYEVTGREQAPDERWQARRDLIAAKMAEQEAFGAEERTRRAVVDSLSRHATASQPGRERATEEGRVLPPYGGLTKCANEPCREPLDEERGVYMHTNRENGKILMLCGPCSRQAQMFDSLRFPLVAL